MWREKFFASAHHSHIWTHGNSFSQQLGKLPKGENGSRVNTALFPNLSLIPATEEQLAAHTVKQEQRPGDLKLCVISTY